MDHNPGYATIETLEEEFVERLTRLSERGWFQRILDWFYGYDYFISYRWSDGRVYAINLAEQLENHGFDCFLDSADYIKGDNWKDVGARSLQKTSRLILIGSAQAIRPAPPRNPEDDPVLRELKVFTATGKRVIPVSFDGSLASADCGDAPLHRYLNQDGLWIAEELSRLSIGPSERTLADLRNSFDVERQTEKRSRILRILIAIFASLAVAATAAAIIAFASFQLAERRRLVAESRGRVADAQRLAAEASTALPLFPQRSLLLAVRAVQATRLEDSYVSEAEQSLRDALAAVDGEPVGKWSGVAPDGNWVAISRNDGSINLDSLASTVESRVFQSGKQFVRVEQSKRWLAASTENGTCWLWNLGRPATPPAVLQGVSRVLAIRDTAIFIDATNSGGKRYQLLQPLQSDSDGPLTCRLVTEFDAYVPAANGDSIAIHRDSATTEIWDLRDLDNHRTVNLELTALLALSPNGQWGLTDKNELSNFAVEPSKRVHLGVPKDWIAFARFSPDSRFLAAVVADPAALSAALSLVQHPHYRLAMVWDLSKVGDSGRISPPAVINSHQTEVKDLFLSGQRVVSVSAESVQVRRLAGVDHPNAELIASMTHRVLLVRILHERWLVAQLHDHSLKVWDLEHPENTPHHFIGHDGPVETVGMSMDGRWLFSNSSGEASRRWTLRAIPGDARNVYRSRWPVRAIALSGEEVAFAGYEDAGPAADGIAKFGISQEGVSLEKEHWRAQNLKSLHVSCNGRWLVWASKYGAEIHDLKSPGQLSIGVWTSTSGKAESCVTNLTPDSRWLTVNSDTAESSLWVLPVGEGTTKRVQLQTENADPHGFDQIAIEPCGYWMLTVDQLGRVRRWSISGDSPILMSSGFGNLDQTASLDSLGRNNRWAVFKSTDGLAWLCDLSHPDVSAVCLMNVKPPVEFVDVSPDGKWALTVSKLSRSLKLSRIQDRNLEITEVAFGERLTDSARTPMAEFSPNSKKLVVWGVDEVVRIWDLNSTPVRAPLELRGHGQLVRHVVYAQGSACLISASDDGTVRLWDLEESGVESVVLRGHVGSVTVLAMTPNQNKLVTGGMDGTIRAWCLWKPGRAKTQRLQGLVESAQRFAGRELSPAELKQYFRKNQ